MIYRKYSGAGKTATREGAKAQRRNESLVLARAQRSTEGPYKVALYPYAISVYLNVSFYIYLNLFR